MWLLGTARANLVFFPRPEDVPDGYAILSHTWLSEEQEDTFKKPPRPSLPSSPPWFNPRDRLSSKVRVFLEHAENADYKYAWVDTCCIDKTSSAELTEAINSMFRYYALSGVCMVYLCDVSTQALANVFRRSLWHHRGWTLQELLASRVIVFFSSEWTPLGTKYELADVLSNVTGIPVGVLRFETPITDVSIAARLSWASKRSTTRPEDKAYCLFGIFGVNMPTLYGEGDNAFYRLLEELMKTSRDASHFLSG
ncbi:heterokaryon incompatibility protein-domain-containing protein, partial [Epithele typhae]|uniref:heterokaryon incompatibility protein-domain-containing protein n=1 Tax=Epithele typhae TaxID=378194 RepID=UPI002008BDC2